MATRPTTSKPKTKPAADRPARQPKTRDPKPERAAKEAKEGVVRIYDLIESIAPNITVKRRDIRTALEASLKAMGEALAAGKVLNLPPLGKISVKRNVGGDKADVAVLKLRRPKEGEKVPGQASAKAAPKGGDADNEGLADDDE